MSDLLKEIKSQKDMINLIERANSSEETKTIFNQFKAMFSSLRKLIQKECPAEYNTFILLNQDLANLSMDIEDEELFVLFKNELNNLMGNINNFLIIIEARLSRISQVQIYTLVKTKIYKSSINKKVYISNKDLIEKTETKILEYFRNGGMPGKSQIAKRDISNRTDNLHADLPYPLDNHRLLYSFDSNKKQITFLKIGTHKELGFGGSGS